MAHGSYTIAWTQIPLAFHQSNPVWNSTSCHAGCQQVSHQSLIWRIDENTWQSMQARETQCRCHQKKSKTRSPVAKYVWKKCSSYWTGAPSFSINNLCIKTTVTGWYSHHNRLWSRKDFWSYGMQVSWPNGLNSGLKIKWLRCNMQKSPTA